MSENGTSTRNLTHTIDEFLRRTVSEFLQDVTSNFIRLNLLVVDLLFRDSNGYTVSKVH